MISRYEADKLYSDNWCLPFIDKHCLEFCILRMSLAGGYRIFVSFKSLDDRREIVYLLRENKYDVNPYNGHNDIIEISWG